MRGTTDALPWFSGSKGMENIYNGLMRHGFSESEAGKILGENWFNFLKDGLEAS